MSSACTLLSAYWLLIVFVLAAVLFASAFWIGMIVDCARREFKNSNDKIVWILVILLLHLPGALAYWLVVKKSAPAQS